MSLFYPLGEPHQLVRNPEDLYFELKNEGISDENACLGMEEGSHSFDLMLAKLDMDNND